MKTILIKLLLDLGIIAFAVWLYWKFVRPRLMAIPGFKPIFDEVDGWWGKFKAWFSTSWTINLGNAQITGGVILSFLDEIKAIDLSKVLGPYSDQILVGMGVVTILLRLWTQRDGAPLNNRIQQ